MCSRLGQEFSAKFGKRTSKEDVFSEITPEPVAAASLGQAKDDRVISN